MESKETEFNARDSFFYGMSILLTTLFACSENAKLGYAAAAFAIVTVIREVRNK